MRLLRYSAALLTVMIVAAISVPAPAALPTGTVTITSNNPPGTPSGYFGRAFTVSVPGVTNNIEGQLAIGAHTSATPRGLVVTSTGGPGTAWWTDRHPELPAFAADLRAAGFTVVQLKWNSNWLQSSPGNDAGTARLGGRPASVIKYIQDNFYVPMNVPAHPAGYGGFIVTGNSGGATQSAYGLSHYGLENIIDVAIPTGGPPHSNLSRAVLAPAGDPARFDLDTRQFIDEGFGIFTGNGPAAQQDASFSPRWDAASVGIGGDDYFHPATRVVFIQGSNDQQMQALASDYYNRLIAEGSPMVEWHVAANTPHAVHGTAEGRALLWQAITAVPEPSLLAPLALASLLLRRPQKSLVTG